MWTTGEVGYDEIFLGKSKQIIERTDDILSKHFRYTNDEREHIKNFDGQFRTGDDEE